MTGPLLGVDVSHYQGAVDWQAVASAGVSFAFAKTSEGASFVDPRYGVNHAGMITAGIIPGAYHFLTAGNAADQADLFCRTATAAAIHALDVEEAGLDVTGWVAAYRKHYPTKPLVIYTGRDLWARAGGGNGATLGVLWAAGVTANRYLPGGPLRSVAAQIPTNPGSVPFAAWTTAAFVQFTDKATITGISGTVDGDVFYGTKADLETYTATGETDMGMNWADKIPLTATDAQLWGGTYKTGDLVSIGEMLRFPSICRRIEAEAKAASAVQAAKLDALTAAVAAIAAASPDAVSAAFTDGISRLETAIAGIKVTVTTETT